jgi:hypothetical protein
MVYFPGETCAIVGVAVGLTGTACCWPAAAVGPAIEVDVPGSLPVATSMGVVAHAGDDADLLDALRRGHLLGDEQGEEVVHRARRISFVFHNSFMPPTLAAVAFSSLTQPVGPLSTPSARKSVA